MEDVKDKITPEKAVELLKLDGIEVDLDQAQIILDFLYQMAEIVVDNYIRQQNIS